MALPLLLPLIGLATSAIGTGVNAAQNAKANKLAEENYDETRRLILAEKYSNPLDNVANKALLSQMGRRLDKQEEAIENRAAAGGATFENTLAAKQAGNEAMADAVSGLLQGEQARQDRFTQQLLNLDSQRTAQQIAAKQNSGKMWSQLGNNVFSAATTLGGVMLENDIPLKDLFKFKG